MSSLATQYPLRRRPFVPLVLSMLAAALVAGCGGDATTAPPPPPPGPPPVASVSVSPSTATLTPGDTVRLTATPKDSAGTALSGRSVTWTSSDTSVATVSSAGLVTARAEGAASVTATSEGQPGTARLTVNPTPVARVALTLDSTALFIGDTVRATAAPLAATGDTLAGRPVAWTSSDSTIATVDSTGLVTARAAGTATIGAGSEGQRDSVVVTVARVPVATVAVRPDSGGAIVGDTLRLTATVLGPRGDTLTDRPVSWTSSDTTIASVDATGLVTAHVPDSVMITATVEGQADTAALHGVLRFTQIAPASTATCALIATGAAYCWGDNTDGELGDGTTTASPLPVPVAGGLVFTQLAEGDHTCGLTSAGAAYCWGDNSVGELGNGGGANSSVPVAVSGGLTFSQLSAGENQTCGLTTGGDAYCWGVNTWGQLGDGSTTAHNTPTAVSGGLKFTRIAANYWHTCALDASGAAYCWGNNDYGQLGDGPSPSSSSPVAVSGGLTFSDISVSESGSTCGLTTAGAAYCWGANNYGEIGDGSILDRNVPTAVSGGLSSFMRLRTGWGWTCGFTADGLAYCWGDNSYGELGDGTMTERHAPVLVAKQ